MKYLAFLVFGFFVLTSFKIPGGAEGVVDDKLGCYVVGKSKKKFYEIFEEGREQGYFYYERLARRILPLFEGIPYGSGGVRCPSDKTLVNFNSFDCVTLVETYWAMSYTLYQFLAGKVSQHLDPFVMFVKNLNRIRYFGGENCGITYRIHYFTQQMLEMERSGMVFNVGVANGYKYRKKINYISENAENYGEFATSYRQKTLEKLIYTTPKYYYPIRHADMYYPLAKDGDIIAFTATEPGLDVTHTGIISVEDGNVRLTHASSKSNKVVYQQDVRSYLRNRTVIDGFLIYRPMFE